MYQVSITLATLSFFCRRPTVLALIEFANAINLEEESCESFSDNSSSGIIKHDILVEEDEQIPKNMEDDIVKGLLGKGRSRVVFNLELKMSRAQIFLVKENESNLASLFQDNLLANIKVLFHNLNLTSLDILSFKVGMFLKSLFFSEGVPVLL